MTAAVVEDRLKRLGRVKLYRGGHKTFEQGHCATEVVSWLAGEPFSDHPGCLSPVLGQFLRSWNDALDDEGRQKLTPYLPRTIGTANDGKDEARAWVATDWLVRVCAPAWLDLAGVEESPAALRALPPITAATVKGAQPTIDTARKQGAAAWDAARDAAGAAAGDAAWAAAGAAAWDAARAAAGDAAWAAAGDAAWDAAWAAAGDAAWDAAGDAAWDAARDAARDAAWAAAGDAAWAAAWDAAGDAAWDAAGDAAWDAARDAARDAAWAAARDAAGDAARAAARAAADKALHPTKVELQASALELLGRMIEGKQPRG